MREPVHPGRLHAIGECMMDLETVKTDNEAALIALLRELSSAMSLEPSGEAPVLRELTRIRAVIFDIYGTLLISGAGDLSKDRQSVREDAIREAVRLEKAYLREGAPCFDSVIAHLQAHRRSEEIAYPEVDIRDVWRTLLPDATDALRERVAIRYETTVNPVWPMPDLEPVLDWLGESQAILGVLSNAERFTPLLFQALTAKSLADRGFDSALCLWSFEEGEAKPSPRLFEKMAQRLTERGVLPDEVLYVGNDIRKDVAPAQAHGFRAALFAGDRRSLRWARDTHPEVKPDLILTELSQLRACLPQWT